MKLKTHSILKSHIIIPLCILSLNLLFSIWKLLQDFNIFLFCCMTTDYCLPFTLLNVTFCYCKSGILFHHINYFIHISDVAFNKHTHLFCINMPVIKVYLCLYCGTHRHNRLTVTAWSCECCNFKHLLQITPLLSN